MSFKVEIIDTLDNVTQTSILKGHESKNVLKSYPIDWKINVYEQTNFEECLEVPRTPKTFSETPVESFVLSPKKQPVVGFRLASQALGDQLIWIPQIARWAEENEVGKVIVTASWNILFKGHYPNIEFVKEEVFGQATAQCAYLYNMGLCLDAVRVGGNSQQENIAGRSDWRAHKLDHVLADTLHLPLEAIRPKLNGLAAPRPFDEKYVAICGNSSAIPKHWLVADGWNKVIKYLIELGYKVIYVSNKPAASCGITLQDPSFIDGHSDNIQDAVRYINHSEFFIGLSSGNSWLAWALNKKVLMIAGLVDPAYEFLEDRYLAYAPENQCHGCFTNQNYMWNRNPSFCPMQARNFGNKNVTGQKLRDLDKAHACVKSITFEVVKEALDSLRDDLSNNVQRSVGLMFSQDSSGIIQKRYLPTHMLEYDGGEVLDLKKLYDKRDA
jgi:autotransporter strand-loop-strand O-heptosyltransferase